MKRTLILSGLILWSVNFAHAQDNKKIEARMVRQPFVAGDALHAIQEVALDLKAHAAGIGDRVAVRVCSKEKMPVALLAATASPFLLREYLEGYEFENRLILFLRSEDCLAQDPSIAVTEFWVVPSGAALPPFVESIRADEVQADLVRPASVIRSAQGYSAALRELVQRTSNRAQVFAVVIGSYYKQPGAALKVNLQTAKRVLEHGDVQANRVFIHAAPFSGIPEGDESEPAYPSLFVFSTEPYAARFGIDELGVNAELPGRSLKWIRIAERHFAREGFKLDRYKVKVFEEGDTVYVTIKSFDEPPDTRGSGGTYSGYEVEINKRTKKITGAHYVR